MPDAPVEFIPGDDPLGKPQEGIALCLSGGGYRAMLFHLGALWRLYETNLLKGIKHISSVSGGSITAGVLGLNWSKLSFDPAKIQTDFVPHVLTPVRDLASETIDRDATILGLALPGRVSDQIAASYDRHLFHGAKLNELPGQPTFVLNATNVQSGALWRFTKSYMRDYRVGEVKDPQILLATAVAASSAFPPVLSPVEMRVDPNKFTPNSGQDLQRKPFTSRVFLTDGGVYDNLGLETAWKRYDTVLVSDGGGKIQPEDEPKSDWAQHSYRVLNLVDNQVRSLRKRQLIESYKTQPGEPHFRKGAYWGIRSDIRKYNLANTLPCPLERTMELAETPTRLKRLDDDRQERLINWGYAVCDAALRAHVDQSLPRADKFPYPAVKV